MVKFGEAIRVDGKRPEWLAADQAFDWSRTEGFTNGRLVSPANRLIPQSVKFSSKEWACIEFIYLPTDHPYYAATSAGFKYWPGGDAAPTDWGFDCTVLFNDGSQSTGGPWAWDRSTYGTRDIIGYRVPIRVDQSAPLPTWFPAPEGEFVPDERTVRYIRDEFLKGGWFKGTPTIEKLNDMLPKPPTLSERLANARVVHFGDDSPAYQVPADLVSEILAALTESGK